MIAQVKVWSVALTQVEIEAERYVDGIVKTTNLWAYYSFRDGPQTVDEGPSSRTLSTSGTPTTEAGPPDVVAPSATYTELEWNLRVQSPAATSEVYQFRVYADDDPLDTYTVTPQLTVGAGAVVYDETGTVDLRHCHCHSNYPS